MSGGNGIDIGAVYQLLQQVAETVGSHGRKLDSLDRRLDAVERRLDGIDRRLNDLEAGQTSLRQAVTDYHASVLGHGILISQLDDRVRRIEQHLNLPPQS